MNRQCYACDGEANHRIKFEDDEGHWLHFCGLACKWRFVEWYRDETIPGEHWEGAGSEEPHWNGSWDYSGPGSGWSA